MLVLTELVFWLALARIATWAKVQAHRVRAPLTLTPEQVQAYLDFFGVPIEPAGVPSITFSTQDASRPFGHSGPGPGYTLEQGAARSV